MTSYNGRAARSAYLLFGTGSLAIMAVTSPAHAAAAAGLAAAGTADDPDAIVVTGTRTGARTAEKSLTPISVASGEDLLRSGRQNLRDALAEVLPSYQLQAGGYQGQQGAGVRGARLRGLDVKDTLILVDGVRRHTTSLYVGDGAPTDLDLIPANAIDHIEVLTDGAAAQYGSDAIAGVINVILKKPVKTGGGLSLYYGQYGQSVGDLPHKYGRTRNVQLSQGWTLRGGGFFNVSGNWQKQNGTNIYPAYAPATLSNRASVLYPTIDGGLDPRETGLSRYRQWLGLPASETYSLAFNTEIPLGSVTFYSNGTYANRYSSGPGYFRTASNQSKAPSSTPSPQDPFANAPYTSGPLIFPDGYLPNFDDRENDFQGVAGFRGEIHGWTWNFSSGYGGDHANIYTKNSINVSAGPANWGQRNFYDGALNNGQLLTTLAANKKFDSGFFGRPLTVSLGIEHRYDSYQQKAGEPLSYLAGPWTWPVGSGNDGIHPNLGAQGMAGFAPAQAGSWHRNNLAAYIELNQQMTDRWTVNLAGRYEYYTDFGSAPSGQLATRYAFSDGFSVRGSFGNGFSAPTLQQQHYTTQSGSYSTDTNSASPTFGTLIQQFTVQTNAGQALGRAIGVRDLKPEHSINASLGFVAKPFPRTTLIVDGYLIDIRNRIVAATALVTPGTPIAAILSAQNVANINSVSFNINGAHTFTKGVDLSLQHSDPIGRLGVLHWTLAVSENVTSIVDLSALPPVVGAASAGALRILQGKFTTYYPRNIASLSLGWDYKKLNVYVKETHWGATEYAGNSEALDQYNAPAFTTDVSVSYDLSKNLRLSAGGTNVFNKRPTRLSASAAALQFISAAAVAPYNSYAPYGLDGGFYYARIDVKW